MTAFRLLSIAAALAACTFAQEPASQQLDFLHGLDEYANIQRMLPDYLRERGLALLEARRRSLAITTPEALSARRQFVRDHMLQAIGGLPERTPLNAKIVGVLQRDGYRIEKVIFESQPKFYVTANLYVPSTGHGPYPAILFPLGHSRMGKAFEIWQDVLVGLVRRGYVALTWDTLAEGERVQLYSADLRGPLVHDSTTEHSMLGIECLLTGQHVARYTIWDGMRALDYLLSRPEVDPARVAVTGNSGGGTNTTYLAALDDRLKAAAPSCYLTSWRWMLKALGPQDGEQVFPGWLANGLDYPDFLYAASPKPYLMLLSIRDFFPIDGSRETFAEAQHVFDSIGQGSKLEAVETDDLHGYFHPHRMAAYDWLSRRLRGASDTTPEAPVTLESPETLDCTDTGQVATSLGGETVFTINRSRAHALHRRRVEPTTAAELSSWQARVRDAALRRTGYEPASGVVPVLPYGVIARDEYGIHKLVYESEPGIQIPALLYVPDAGPERKAAVLLADGNGKSAAADTAARLARSGVIVLAVDLRGMGETRFAAAEDDSEFHHWFGDYNDAMTALLIGHPLAGMRARDIVRGLDLLATRPDVDPARLSGIARHGAAIPMLYAGLFDARLKSIALENMLVCYDAAASSPVHSHVLEDVVPGALEEYDLPDLVAAIAPRNVWISDPVTPTGSPVLRPELTREYAAAANAFRLAGAPEALHLALVYRQ